MYNALQVKLNRRFSGGLLITGAYTWGKGMSYQRSDDGVLDFYINGRRNYARTDFDRTQTFVSSFVYSLPFGSGQRWLPSGVGSRILGGWQMNGILTLTTGLPLTPNRIRRRPQSARHHANRQSGCSGSVFPTWDRERRLLVRSIQFRCSGTTYLRKYRHQHIQRARLLRS